MRIFCAGLRILKGSLRIPSLQHALAICACISGTGIGITSLEQGIHVRWLLNRIQAVETSCPLPNTNIICADSLLPISTVTNAWDGNVGLNGLTPFPAASSSNSNWSKSENGSYVKSFNQADGAFYVVTIIPRGSLGSSLIVGVFPSISNALPLPTESRLAKLITPFSKPSYAQPLKPTDQKDRSFYNIKGPVAKLTQKNFQMDGSKLEISDSDEYYFSPDGYLVRNIVLDKNGLISVKEEFDYRDRKLTSKRFTNDVASFYSTYSYDEKGNWQEQRDYDSKNNLTSIRKIIAFPNGYELTAYSLDGSIYLRSRVLINERQEEIEREGPINSEPSDIKKIYSNGKLAKSIFGSATTPFMMTTEYDIESGEIVRSEISSPTMGKKVISYSCTRRDSYLNCVNRVIKESEFGSNNANRVTRIEESEIVYYRN